MLRSLIRGALLAVASAVVLATPVLAHGDHDARPLARHLAAGPYTISLWQVYPDAGSSMTPHLIVMFDDQPAVPAGAQVDVAVNGAPAVAQPSMTNANGLETADGLAPGDEVTVTVSNGIEAWRLEPVVVPPPATSMLPMQELIYTSIFLTAATAWWVARRTARAWRRPVTEPVLSRVNRSEGYGS